MYMVHMHHVHGAYALCTSWDDLGTVFLWFGDSLLVVLGWFWNVLGMVWGFFGIVFGRILGRIEAARSAARKIIVYIYPIYESFHFVG